MPAYNAAEALERTQLILARQQLGLTRSKLGQKIGLTSHSVFKIEKGFRDPSLALIHRWVEALGPYGTLELFRKPYRPRRGNVAAEESAA